jgi:integrase
MVLLDLPMDDLQYQLNKLCLRYRQGSHSTQADRKSILDLCARQLKEMGYRNMRLDSIKPKHVEALVRRWQGKDERYQDMEPALSAGTIKNRMAYLRWWAEKAEKPTVIPGDNAKLGIEFRQYVKDTGKQIELDPDKLALVRDEHLRLSLELQSLFGLRREEAMKFQPEYAIRLGDPGGDVIRLKQSWTKGGRPRDIPVLHESQRDLLERVRHLAGAGSLIPAQRSYDQQKNLYERETKRAGIAGGDDAKCHGLRHGYAQRRYEELTGWKCPHAGGPKASELTPEQKIQDHAARMTISAELGHGREEITAVYLGR